MRKSEMSKVQLQNRSKFLNMLDKANWYYEGVPEESFNADYWNEDEASFLLQRRYLKIQNN
jgi:hypothetical protein